MSQFSQVAWKEGMFMMPQHFQQADRALSTTLNQRFFGDNPLGWGIQSLEISKAGITQGRVEIVSCRAILSDGLTLNIPETDAAPEPRGFELKAGKEALKVYLVVPTRREGVPTLSRDERRSDVRFLEREVEIADEYKPENKQPIRIAAKNIRLCLSGDALDGNVVCEIAQIRRGPDGVPVLVEDFIPPALWVSSSRRLEQMLKELVAVTDAKAQACARERQERVGEVSDFSAADLKSFWFLYALSSSLPCLRQSLELREVHPYEIFNELLRLAGALIAVSGRYVKDLPEYSHNNLYQCFSRLDRLIRSLLNPKFRYRCLTIPMEKTEHYWFATISDANLLDSGQFLLALIGDVDREETLSQLSRTLKLADSDGIDQVVINNLAGLPFRLATQVPNSIPQRDNARYLLLKTEGPYWEAIRKTGQLAAYLPGWLSDIKLELLGIFGGRK